MESNDTSTDTATPSVQQDTTRAVVFAVQVAKALGAEVTAVCSKRNVETARSNGADHIIDYTKEDFAQAGMQYDLIFDVPGNRSVGDYKRVLAPEGTYVMVGGQKVGGWVLFLTLPEHSWPRC